MAAARGGVRVTAAEGEHGPAAVNIATGGRVESDDAEVRDGDDLAPQHQQHDQVIRREAETGTGGEQSTDKENVRK